MQEEPVEKLLYSIEQSAEVLSISPWTIRNYAKRGILPTVKIGQRRLVRASDLKRVAAEGLESLGKAA